MFSHAGASGEHRLTRAHEDYLETIYVLTQEQGNADGIRSVEVAERMDVSKASVNKALSVLKDGGYVIQQHYGKVMLTERGTRYAAQTWRCHRMLRKFLETELGVDPSVADGEACLMEHALSEDTMQRWLAYLEAQGLKIEEI